MNRLIQYTALLPLLAIGAAAQESTQLDGTLAQLDAAKKKLEAEQVLRMKIVGSVQGPLVKGMPYSADEISETDQTLADGTRIHRETKTSVYRDSEGRTRRETPDNITINDPVAGATYMINPKTNSVRKLQMANTMIYRREGAMGAVAGPGGPPTTFSFRTSGDGQSNIEINGKQLDPKQVQEMIAKAKAEGHARSNEVTALDRPEAGMVTAMDTAPGSRVNFAPKGESLGKKNMEGVIAEGTRNVETIETGAIGNDRPIQVVNEHWFSEELGMMIYSKRSDPRTGDETFRITNIRRGDPAPYLFQPPAGAAVQERKM